MLLPAVFDQSPDLLSAASDFFNLAAQHLRESDYADACPIATVALEVSSSSEPLREACAEVFGDWIAAGTDRFVQSGIDPEQARELTISMLCLLEGAFIFARAMRSTDPIEVAGKAAVSAIEAALAGQTATG
jgi:hypothetical protein